MFFPKLLLIVIGVFGQVGKGLSKDAKAQTLAFQHWIEAVTLLSSPFSISLIILFRLICLSSS